MEKSTVVDSATGWSKDSRFSIMKLVRNMIRTMIISMMNSIPRMGINVLLPFSCILYLLLSSDVEEGGETVFPSEKVNSSSLPWYNELSDCAKQFLSVKPKMGDALLFWSMRPDATPDPSSLHGGCPVIKGNK
ncbi:unnamed protein product, partial [Musa acuminata subsp. burmannicoides]